MSLVVVSNRLPFTAVRGENGEWQVEPGSGGLVTALRPVLGNRGGRWIGWSGATEEELPDARELFQDSQHRFGYELIPVPLTTAERDGFYAGFSNEIVRRRHPHDRVGEALVHGLVRRPVRRVEVRQ